MRTLFNHPSVFKDENAIHTQERRESMGDYDCRLVLHVFKLFKLGFALGNSRNGRSARMIKGSGAGVQKILLTNSVLPKMQRVITQISLFALSSL
jgi:hypothetical protein